MKSRCKISMTKRIFTTLWVLCLACKLGFGQDMVLSGTVKDVQGSPMPGVAVLIKGTTLGVVTQNDGTYSLFMGQADKDAVVRAEVKAIKRFFGFSIFGPSGPKRGPPGPIAVWLDFCVW